MRWDCAARRGGWICAPSGSTLGAAAVRLEDDGMMLLRPDGFIAWRTRQSADATVLDGVLTSVTGHWRFRLVRRELASWDPPADRFAGHSAALT
ncbi:aromatic-ring hydroxylase C-terminal domain-containing protein [Streptomyces silvisoli]|uniref:Uncharacterized protein n=1 Tax=Streptomyces silvisoli TaxID=3034235 RepID=A0ABT5ZE54_9ACTN|nr:hypothetical protein [Streptomyces silvisoli]MDF3288106.1 hypothetical protein [Streptomyces silvisoli]